MTSSSSGSDARVLTRRRRVAIVVGLVAAGLLGISLGVLLGLLAFGMAGGTFATILLAVIVLSFVTVVPTTVVLARTNRELQRRGLGDDEKVTTEDISKRRKTFRRLLVVVPITAILIVGNKLMLDASDEPDVLPWAAVALLIGALAAGLLVTWWTLRMAVANQSE